MSEPNPSFRYPSHSLVVYNFNYHSHIPPTYARNVLQSHRKQRTGLKWTGQLITQICRLIYVQCLHCSKLINVEEALDDHAKGLILDADITDEHERGQDALTEHYTPYCCTHLSVKLDTLIRGRENWYPLIKTARETTGKE